VPHPRLETPLTSERFPAVLAIQKEFLNSKRCLCLIPCGIFEGMDEFAERYRQFPGLLSLITCSVWEKPLGDPSRTTPPAGGLSL